MGRLEAAGVNEYLTVLLAENSSQRVNSLRGICLCISLDQRMMTESIGVSK